MEKRRIHILDTTLRDGEQSPGCSMNIQEKLEFSKQLERLGVDAIEAGFPVASQDDFVSVKQIADSIKNCAVVALTRAVESEIARTYEAIKGAVRPRIHVFLATSDLHLQHKLHMTREEALMRVCDTVRFAKGLCEEVEFSAEDASRSDRDYLLQVVTAAAQAGATVINIPDTVGYATPEEMEKLIYTVKNAVAPLGAQVSVHCHNDLGLATANTIAAIRGGADQIEGTILGIGERAGNVSLEEVIMAVQTRKDQYPVEFGVQTRQIYRTAKLLSTIIGSPIPHNKPIVGANAFAHASGIHQHGILRERGTYEILNPEEIGVNQNKIILSKHSGKHALQERLDELGYALSPEDVEEVFKKFKVLADKKREVSDKDLEALIGSYGLAVERAYSLHTFVVNSGSVISGTAVVSLTTQDGQVLEQVARGDGPIDAAFTAIESIVQKGYPLHSYSIQSVTEGEDALGEVVVKLKKEGRMVTGRGLSTDIIEASIKAYLNAINKIEAIEKNLGELIPPKAEEEQQ